MTGLRRWWIGCDRCPSRRFHRAIVRSNRELVARLKATS